MDAIVHQAFFLDYKVMNVKVLSKLLSHANVNMTYNIYVHLYANGFDETYSALVSENVREGFSPD